MPTLYIITGSNGAGKSSVGPSFLPAAVYRDRPVFDGDKLYMEQQRALWQQGIRAVKEAKKLALAFVQTTFDDLVAAALAAYVDFAYEGHFTNDATWTVPKQFADAGYEVHLIFLGLNDADLSELRVVDRTKEGGHYVPRKTIEDNFYGNLEKLNQYHSLLNSLKIIDTSETGHRLLAHFIDQQVIYALPAIELPAWFTEYLPDLYTFIQKA